MVHRRCDPAKRQGEGFAPTTDQRDGVNGTDITDTGSRFKLFGHLFGSAPDHPALPHMYHRDSSDIVSALGRDFSSVPRHTSANGMLRIAGASGFLNLSPRCTCHCDKST